MMHVRYFINFEKPLTSAMMLRIWNASTLQVTNVTTVEKLGTLPASALMKCRSPEEEEGGVVGVEPATPVERKATCPGTVLMEAPGEAAVEETRSATTATGPDIWPVIAPTLAAAVAAVVVVVAGNRLATSKACYFCHRTGYTTWLTS